MTSPLHRAQFFSTGTESQRGRANPAATCSTAKLSLHPRANGEIRTFSRKWEGFWQKLEGSGITQHQAGLPCTGRGRKTLSAKAQIPPFWQPKIQHFPAVAGEKEMKLLVTRAAAREWAQAASTAKNLISGVVLGPFQLSGHGYHLCRRKYQKCCKIFAPTGGEHHSAGPG